MCVCARCMCACVSAGRLGGLACASMCPPGPCPTGLQVLAARPSRRRPAPSACEPSRRKGGGRGWWACPYCCGGQRARAARIRRACVAPRAVCGGIAPAAPQASCGCTASFAAHAAPQLPPRRARSRLPRHASVVRSDERADPLRHCRALDPPCVDGVQLRRTGR